MVMLTVSRIDSFSEKLIEFVARASSGIRMDKSRLAVITGPTLLPIVLDVISKLTNEIAIKNESGLLYCGLCRKGPFTKRGMYLHLIRVHRYEIKTLISDELERRLFK